MTHADFQRLVDAPKGGRNGRWRPTVNLVETLREQKDVDEVAHIVEAVRIAESALGPHDYHGACRDERARRGRYSRGNLRAAGSEAHPFETIVASGERAALPHARCSARRIEKGEWLLIDFGAVSGGYCSDITRTFVVGKATDEQRALFEIVRESNASASGAVRAGMRGKDADAVARGYIERHGWGEEFGHSLGHGIGLEIHEAPRLAKTADAPLPVDAVVTIEPGIYRPGWGGVRIEDDVLLAPDGPKVLTTFARDLIELGGPWDGPRRHG